MAGGAVNALAPPIQPSAPHNEEAEKALLGAILIGGPALDMVADSLRPEHFYFPVHGRIYAAALRQRELGHRASVVTMGEEFASDRDLGADLGGKRYLVELAADFFSEPHSRDYAAAIIHAWRRRITAQEFRTLADEAAATDQPGTFLADATARVKELERNVVAASVSTLNDHLDRFELDLQAGDPPGLVRTGLADVDKATGGIQPGEQLVIGAATSMGKTALGCTIALNAAEQGHRVIFESLEMEEQRILARLVAAMARVPVNAIRYRNLGLFQRDQVREAVARLRKLPITVLKRPALTLSTLRADLETLGRDAPIGLLIVDYIQLMRPSRERQGNSRALDLGEIANGLKEIALDWPAPVITLAQVNRGIANREDKRPQLSDLRDSGEIEQAADQVWFIHRPEYYLEREKPPFDASADVKGAWADKMTKARGRAEIITAKHRDGETGMREIAFEPSFCRFGNLANAA